MNRDKASRRVRDHVDVDCADCLIARRPGASGTADGGSVLLRRLLANAAEQLDRCAPPWPGLPAIERVAAFVEDFARRARAGSGAGERINLPMTRAQLGSYLGLAEETIVRALAQLRAGNRLDIKGRSVLLHSWHAS